jgi:Spy/CpxP family protein refolding chaperone
MLANSKKSILLITTLFIIGSGIAYAQGPKAEFKGKQEMPEKMQQHKGPMIPDLTEKQQDQMKDLRIEHLKQVKPLRDQIHEHEAHLHTLQTADKVNMAEINKAIEDIGTLRIEIMKLDAVHHQKVRSLLTEEQRLMFDTHQPRHEGQHGSHVNPGCGQH